MMVPRKIIGDEFSGGSDVYVERNEALLDKYKIMCGNGVTKLLVTLCKSEWLALSPPLSVYL